jgi:hypothetical protein
MKDTHWIDLLRLIPEDQHNKLVVTTLTGVDLNVEMIMRMDETFLVFRGRISGITDEGRVFFVPYRQIDYLQMNRNVRENEIRELFGTNPEMDGDRAQSGALDPAPSGVFAAVTPASGSKQGLSANAPAPTRPSLPGIAAKLPTLGTGGRGSNPAVPAATADAPTPPRNSILERLRAQRNSVVSIKPLNK